MQERPLAQQPRAIVHVLRTTAALLLVRKPLQIALALRIAHLLVQRQHPTMEHLLVAVAITTAVVTIAVRPHAVVTAATAAAEAHVAAVVIAVAEAHVPQAVEVPLADKYTLRTKRLSRKGNLFSVSNYKI